MKLSRRSLGLIGLLGGVGGALSWGLHGFASMGLVSAFTWGPFSTEPTALFVGLGAVNGFLLAVLSVWPALLMWDEDTGLQCVLGIPLWWISSWMSMIPLQFYVISPLTFPPAWDELLPSLLDALVWPFKIDGFAIQVQPLAGIVAPFLACAVVPIYYVFLSAFRVLTSKNLVTQIAASATSAFVGSQLMCGELTKRTVMFSLAFGVIWGSLVGFGVWKSQGAATPR